MAEDIENLAFRFAERGQLLRQARCELQYAQSVIGVCACERCPQCQHLASTCVQARLCNNCRDCRQCDYCRLEATVRDIAHELHIQEG